MRVPGRITALCCTVRSSIVFGDERFASELSEAAVDVCGTAWNGPPSYALALTCRELGRRRPIYAIEAYTGADRQLRRGS